MMILNKEFWEPITSIGGPASVVTNHRYLFWFVIATYLPTIALLQLFMRNRFPYRLKWISFTWNLLLSLLSGLGAMIYLVYKPSVLLTLNLPDDQNHPYIRAVMAVFGFSKLFEFGDTYLLILKKKPLIFLHVYHHLTTALYSWHSQSITVGYGHLFAFINLVIHTWMYFYYAMSIITPRHPMLRAMRPYITLSQIIQMFGGMYIAYAIWMLPSIAGVYRTNALCGLLMYMSYAYLFVMFYLQSYLKALQPAITISSGTMLLAAALGLKFLWEHPQRLHLSIEIGIGYALTMFLVQNFTSNLQSKLQQQSTTSSSLSTASSNNQWTRFGLMIQNFWICWALEHQQLQEVYDATTVSKNTKEDEVMMKKKKRSGSSDQNNLVWLMTDMSHISDALTKDDGHMPTTLLQMIPLRFGQSRFHENWMLVVASVVLPAMYGHIMHGSALLGFLIHGCLRWCIELYTINGRTKALTSPASPSSSHSGHKVD